METSQSMGQVNSVVRLDTRGKEPPQPILLVLKQLGELPQGHTLEVLLDSNPFQLYDLLQQRGFQIQCEPQQGAVLGRVCRKASVESH